MKFRFILRGFIFVFVAITIVTLCYYAHKAKIKNFAYEFNGKVVSVSYDDKMEATVFIGDSEYYLTDPSWDFDHNRIQVGDSLIKRKNSMLIKLVKKDGKILTQGENN
jgi:hypothetical protein